MKKIILMLAICGSLVTVSAQSGQGGEDVNPPRTGTVNPTYTPNPGTTGQNPSNDNDNQGGTGQGGSDQGTNGNYQGNNSGNNNGTYDNSNASGTYTQTPSQSNQSTAQSSSSSQQGNIDVPDKVKSSFSDKYQDANATWSREGQNFKARFKEDQAQREETIVVYDKNGEVVRTQRMLKPDNYPESLSKYYKDQNTDMKGYDVWEVTGNGPTKYYTSHNGKMTWFDNEGNVMHGTAHATKGKSSTQKSNVHSKGQKSGTKSDKKKASGSHYTGSDEDRDMDLNRKP